VSSADGLALAGALVTAAPVGAGNVVTVRSDSEGAYEITQLPAGRYRVTVRRPGFIRWSYGQVDAMQSGRVLVLRANTQARKIDVTLPRSGVVSGTVTDRFGVPVEGVLLQLLEPRAVGGRQQLVAVAGITAKSDDLGQYRLAGVDPGSYYVRAIDETPPGAPPLVDSPGRSTFHPGHDTPEAALALPVDVGLDAAGTDIVFAPGPSARVSGEVFDSQGKPFTGDMTLATSSRNVSPLLESRSIQATDGRFEFLGVPPGDYVIQAVESTSTFNVASRLSRSSGTAAGLTAAQTETTSFGVAFVTVTSAADDPAPMSIAMSRGHTIRAQIAFNGSGLSTDSFTPTLVAVPADLDFTPRAGTPRPAVRALDDGTFEITNVVGPFRLALSAGGDGEWWLKRVKVDGVDVKDDPVTLSHIAPDDTELDVVVARNAATIGGRVVTASRQPVGSGSVLVFSTNPDDWYERSRYVRTAEAGENGQFTVGGLAPGDYWMVALDIAPPPAYKLSGEFLRRVASFATHVTLSEGQHRQTDLRPMKLPR
jgi:hypothetical protein